MSVTNTHINLPTPDIRGELSKRGEACYVLVRIKGRILNYKIIRHFHSPAYKLKGHNITVLFNKVFNKGSFQSELELGVFRFFLRKAGWVFCLWRL